LSDLKEPQYSTLKHAVPNECRRYKDRVVIVTGAAQGLGRVIAQRLAEEGASLMLCDISEAQVERTAKKLQEETGQTVRWSCGDLAQEGVAEDVIEATLAEFGRIDTLINNAAALIRMRLEEFSEELLQKAVDWNVWNTLRCCKAVLPVMQKQQYGRIVNVGGEAWRTGAPFHTLLGGVGKGSMVGLTATLAGDTVKQGITVNCISPGGIESIADGDFEGRSLGKPMDPAWNPPERMKELMEFAGSSKAGMGRLAHPSEVASAIAYFGSPEASFVTGQHIGVSGGMVMI
jgi:NAD(P)-dependent dehydrogenase (short-subunit alcohol dehydrogenase family)